MEYKVLITTSGTGSRLGDLSKYTNKALVRVGKKPVISYIVESYPVETPFVVTIGYFGEHVRDFLTLTYPERHFTFVEVDKYIGDGSSLGYSMLQARDHLQCPFIFHASDTMVTGDIAVPTENWIGVYKGTDATQYSSWRIEQNGTLVFQERGAATFDVLHIGLIGVYEYKKYWDILDALYAKNPNDQSLNDCKVLVNMLATGSAATLRHFESWYDTGNLPALARARAEVADHFDNLDKLDESIFLFNNFVVKFFADTNLVAERVERALSLGNLVPKIEGIKKNFYRYEYAVGQTYADIATPATFIEFLAWAKQYLWKPVRVANDATFAAICRDFYYDKTKKRVAQFHDMHGLADMEHVINGEKVPTIAAMLEAIDMKWLTHVPQYQFHGDFILDNTIKTKDGYTLIDWRQNFGGLLTAGDRYYDLAKLNHNLTVNHEIVARNQFTVNVTDGNVVTCDIHRKNNLVECQELLFAFIEAEGLEAERVRLLTSICWLNSSPLHEEPYSQFLYYFSKLHLWRALKNLQSKPLSST